MLIFWLNENIFNARTILYTKLEDTNASLREKYGFRKKILWPFTWNDQRIICMNALSMDITDNYSIFSVQFLVLAARCLWGRHWGVSLNNPIQYNEIMEDIRSVQYITWLIFDSLNLTFTKNFCWRGTAHHGLDLRWWIPQQSL